MSINLRVNRTEKTYLRCITDYYSLNTEMHSRHRKCTAVSTPPDTQTLSLKISVYDHEQILNMQRHWFLIQKKDGSHSQKIEDLMPLKSLLMLLYKLMFTETSYRSLQDPF